jgi:glycerol-1-phosphate dehydrogenase [NAD(P)+]
MTAEPALLDAALRAARDTRCLRVSNGARREAAGVFASLFSGRTAAIIADENTFAAAGADVYDSLRAAGQPCLEPLILGPDIHAEMLLVERVEAHLEPAGAIGVAVGSGTINDLTKLASGRRHRPYLTVATAASMDGYTSFGASILYQGSKQTFPCPAPLGVVADLDVIQHAPEGMNASGYADLLAKCPAGADWIVADACGVEPVNAAVWDTVQSRLRAWIADPAAVRRREPEALHRLVTGLMMTGFAMQAACSSRPASGAEHQFSHLWDMQHHTYRGVAPSHGFKVGIGSLASLALYEAILDRGLDGLDIDAAVSRWPEAAENDREIAALFPQAELAATARKETGAKYIDKSRLRSELTALKEGWPSLRARLSKHLLSRAEAAQMLAEAGAPTGCTEIGITRARLKRSHLQAYHIRRRYTVLDLARRSGLMTELLDKLYPEEARA